LWTFQDGQTSTEPSPKHTFTQPAGYHVVLTVSDDNGRSAQKDMTITATATSGPWQPVAKLTATPTSGDAPLVVQFRSKSLYTKSVEWDFGDSSAKSTEKNPRHTYSTAGTYDVTLTAINGSNTNTATTTITINQRPVLKINGFSANVVSGNAPLKVSFTSDVSGNPTSYTWMIGKSSVSSKGGTAKYTITKQGVYDVTLVVKDAKGQSDSMTKQAYITVLPKPKPPVSVFSAKPTSGKAPLTVQFTDKSQNNPTEWKWNFGDGKTSTEQSPTHTYTNPGSYAVSLGVKNEGGNNIKQVKNFIVVTRK